MTRPYLIFILLGLIVITKVDKTKETLWSWISSWIMYNLCHL